MAKASPVDLEAAFWADVQTRGPEGTKILTSGSGETSLGDGDDFDGGDGDGGDGVDGDDEDDQPDDEATDPELLADSSGKAVS